MKEIDPQTTKRFRAVEMWKDAPQPMVTLIKKFNIKNLVKLSKENDLKLNMLLCYCIGRAASSIEEFYLLPINEKLYYSEDIAINVIVKTKDGSIHFCDIPFSNELKVFNKSYLELTKKVYETNSGHDLSDRYMIIGTSAVNHIYLDGIINMYSGLFNNPFLAWGKYKKKNKKCILPISFQFHHSQMDGEEAGRFLIQLKKEIKSLAF